MAPVRGIGATLITAGLIASLAGCTAAPNPSVTVTASTPRPSPRSATPSPTPTPTLISLEQGADLYLKVICPTFALDTQFNRAWGASDWEDVKAVSRRQGPQDRAAAKALDAVAWPGTLRKEMATYTDRLRSFAEYDDKVAAAASQSDADSIEGPSSATNNGPTVRKGLGLKEDGPANCLGNLEPAFPAGYPKIVKTSSLPSGVRGEYESSGTADTALAVAPGVWSRMDPGASVGDTIYANQLNGYCGSKSSFERKYEFGQDTAGSCY